MLDHSILPPSSASRRIACPGSRALEEKYPSIESTSSREGHAAHWVASELLKGNTVLIDTIAPNNEIITAEMLEGAQLFRDTVLEDAEGAELHIEETIPITYINKNCYGTPDCWFIKKNQHGHDKIFIYDYKFGHTAVEIIENWQLIEYAAGVFEKVSTNNFNTQFTLTVIQPRSFDNFGPVKRWVISVNHLNEYWNQLIDAEKLSLKNDAPCIPNPECKYCSARAACTALQNTALNAIEIAKTNLSHVLTPVELGNELRLLEHYAKLLDARITGLQEQALVLIQNGEHIPHYVLDFTKPRQQWNKSAEEIIELGKLFNIDLSVPPAVITPPQAIKRGLPDELVKEITYRPHGSPKLTQYNSRKIKQLFQSPKEDS